MKNTIIIILAVAVLIGIAAPSANAKDYGPFVVGTPVLGSTRDTLLVPDLYYWIGNASVVGKYLYVSSTTDLAAPMNEAMQIEIHTATTGSLALDTASSSSAGPSADWTAGDVVWIMDNPPTNSKIRAILSATKVATGVQQLNYMLYLQNTADTIDNKLEYQEDMAESTRDSLSYVQKLLWGATGFPALTGAKFVAAGGISLGEGLVDLADRMADVDSSVTNARTAVTAIQTAQTTANYGEWYTISATINLVNADSVWTTVGTNEVFDVTGTMTEAYLSVWDSIGIGGADSIGVQVGTTVVTKVLKSEWAAGEYLSFPAALGAYRTENPSGTGLKVILAESTAGAQVLHFANLTGLDIGYVVGTATPITTGTLRFLLTYRMAPGGSVALGLGGSL